MMRRIPNYFARGRLCHIERRAAAEQQGAGAASAARAGIRSLAAQQQSRQVIGQRHRRHKAAEAQEQLVFENNVEWLKNAIFDQK